MIVPFSHQPKYEACLLLAAVVHDDVIAQSHVDSPHKGLVIGEDDCFFAVWLNKLLTVEFMVI